MSCLSIEIIGKEFFVSKNALKSMKNNLKKHYNSLENKDKFLESINKEEFEKYLKKDYNFSVSKINDVSFKVEIKEDNEKKMERKKLEIQTHKRKQLKNKIKNLRDRRNNVFGKKINNLKKSHDSKLLEKYINAKNENLKFRPNKDGTISIQGNKPIEIPDPNEIDNDKDKWKEEFTEFKNTVDSMEKSKEFFVNTAYYKYITAVLETF